MKVHLKQVMPSPMFQVVERAVGANKWAVSIRDDQSDDSVHFEASKRYHKAPLEDVVKAGGRECANGTGIVAVTRYDDGIPTLCVVYAVMYAFGRWQLRRLR